MLRLEDGCARERVVCIAKVARVSKSDEPDLRESHEKKKKA